MLTALLFLPLCAGCIMLLWGRAVVCRVGLPLTALGHTALAAMTAARVARGEAPAELGGLLAPDPLGTLFLMLASVLFLTAAFYAMHYLREEERIGEHTNILDHGRFTNTPERRFTACLCFFLASMTLVTITPHMGAQWVGIEATTLSSAQLIYFHRHKRSLEATWKYLIICSVGIALALLGNILLSVAFHSAEAGRATESLDQVGWFVRNARLAEPTWLKAAFVFLLVGYGTKMGLAPLHNWLPDAHSQAPSLVSALLSGALLNCAMLGVLRGHQIMLSAGLGGLSGGMLIFFGLLSLMTAAIFIVGQGHYKRMLAYSSVEHMGILALGIGVGGAAVSGAMLHAVCHSLTKCMLFLLSGNILARYHTYSSYDVRGMRWTMPVTAALWTAGFLAVAGSPPFGLFISELLIFKGMLAADRPWLSAAYLTLLAIIFVGLSVAVLRMVQGNRPVDMAPAKREPALSVLPPLVLGLAVLTLGLWIPHWLWNFLTRAAALVGA